MHQTQWSPERPLPDQSPQGHKEMDEPNQERRRAHRGKAGPNVGKNALQKLTYADCKIYIK